MLQNITAEHGCGCSEFPFRSGKWPIRLSFVPALMLLFALCSISLGAGAQSAESKSVSAYAEAIGKSTIVDRVAAMERYLALPSGGTLRVDALEFLVWDYLQLGRQTQSVQSAKNLLAVSPGNAIAIAVLHQDHQPGLDLSPTRRHC